MALSLTLACAIVLFSLFFTGSFLEQRPLSGGFEANPPFLEEVMAPMAFHVLALLERAQKAGLATDTRTRTHTHTHTLSRAWLISTRATVCSFIAFVLMR